MTKRDEKMQRRILKALLKNPKNVYYFEYGENFVAVTWNNTFYILPKNDIYFDLCKCKKSAYALNDLLKMYKSIDDKELTLTNILVQEKKSYCRKLKAESLSTWVNDKSLKDFGNAKYYASKPLGRVLVIDSETDNIIGCVFPAKVKEESK